MDGMQRVAMRGMRVAKDGKPRVAMECEEKGIV